MGENELQERRRSNLRQWVEERGGVAACLVGKPSIPNSYQSYISQVLNGYSFGSRAARTIESRLGMPSQWLDQDRTGAEAAVGASSRAQAVSEELASLGEAMGRIRDPRARAAAYLAALDVLTKAAEATTAGVLYRKQQTAGAR